MTRGRRQALATCLVFLRRGQPEIGVNSGESDRAQLVRAMGLATGIGCTFATCLGIGVGAGVVLTHAVGNAIPLVLGIALGFAAGGYGVYRMVMGVFR